MIRKVWRLVFIVLSLNANSFAQALENKDKCDSDSLDYIGFPRFEIPVTVAPFARGDLLFPIGIDKGDLSYVGIGGGNYLWYPSPMLKFGLFAGFSFGDFRRKKFSGVYTYQKIERDLYVNVSSRLADLRLGIKVINYTSNKRIKPYSELCFSRMIFSTRLFIDEKRQDERNPPIEFQVLEKDYTNTYQINSGFEISLMKKNTIQNKNYKGKGFFVFAAVGYVHGLSNVRQIDITKAKLDKNEIENSDLNFIDIKSKEINFIRFAPLYETKIRFINISFGMVFRL